MLDCGTNIVGPPSGDPPITSKTWPVNKRYRCIRCRSRIDTDLHSCPACGEKRPLRYLRSRVIALRAIFVVVVVAAASAWFVLV